MQLAIHAPTLISGQIVLINVLLHSYQNFNGYFSQTTTELREWINNHNF